MAPWLWTSSTSSCHLDLGRRHRCHRAHGLERRPQPLQRQQEDQQGYLTKEFHNVKQGNLYVDDYPNRHKVAADALAEFGAPVSNSDLVTNVIKGLDERFDTVSDITPLLTLFPAFLNFYNMLLLQEMKVARCT
jgi:hypothetical protein